MKDTLATKPLQLRGVEVAAGRPPLICVPLIGGTSDELRAELAAILPKQPDLLEWRVDFFGAIRDAAQVVEVARFIHAAAENIPLIFTCRAVHEGGERSETSDEDVLALHEQVCASGAISLLDYEMSHPAGQIERLRAASRRHGVAMILSFHDFQATPGTTVLLAKIAEAERLGADIAKIAVMPNSAADVEILLGATRQASRSASIPLITMSMGELGLRSRIEGWQYGSTVTFAAGKGVSAPGQISIESLRAALASGDVLNAP